MSQSFLGMLTYLAPFVPNLSEHTTELRKLLRKDSEFQWYHEHDIAFQKRKSLICQANSLAYYDPKQPAILQVDASQVALGAALVQDNRPIVYASKSLTDTEKRYANVTCELSTRPNNPHLILYAVFCFTCLTSRYCSAGSLTKVNNAYCASEYGIL